MTQEQTPLVEIRHLGFRRGQRVIYEDISLSIPRGKVTAIMGPSGIGKTCCSMDRMCMRRAVANYSNCASA